jgi:hypothetical protein
VEAHGTPLLHRPQPLGPELGEGLVTRGEVLEAESLGVVADLGVGMAADHVLELRAQVHRGLALDAAEELLPLDLQLADRLLEDVEVFAQRHYAVSSPVTKSQKSGSQSSLA